MRIYSWILLVVAMSVCLVSCNNGQKKVDESGYGFHSDVKTWDSSLSYYDFVGHPESEFNYYDEFCFSVDDILHAMNPVEPENIKAYIDDIIVDGEFVIDRYDKENSVAAIRDLADKLQSYKDGCQKYFPDKELNAVLSHLLHEIAYADNHADWLIPRDFIIFPRLLEIAASLCPDICRMATYTSPNKNVGIITIESGYNSQYDFTAVIAETEDAYSIHYLPQSFCRINKIRHVGSSDYRELYLLSYEDGCLFPVHCPSIYLIGYSGTSSGYASVTIYDLSDNFNFNEWSDFIYNDEEADDHQVYFNPKEICWSWCKKNKFGKLEKIEGSKSLYVDMESYSLRIE